MGRFFIGNFLFTRFSVSADHVSLSQTRIQNLFTNTKAGRCNLQKLITIDEIQRLLQTQDSGRSQFQSLICAGRTGIGQVFCFADIQLDIFALAALADDHAGVNLFTGTDMGR